MAQNVACVCKEQVREREISEWCKKRKTFSDDYVTGARVDIYIVTSLAFYFFPRSRESVCVTNTEKERERERELKKHTNTSCASEFARKQQTRAKTIGEQNILSLKKESETETEKERERAKNNNQPNNRTLRWEQQRQLQNTHTQNDVTFNSKIAPNCAQHKFYSNAPRSLSFCSLSLSRSLCHAMSFFYVR